VVNCSACAVLLSPRVTTSHYLQLVEPWLNKLFESEVEPLALAILDFPLIVASCAPLAVARLTGGASTTIIVKASLAFGAVFFFESGALCAPPNGDCLQGAVAVWYSACAAALPEGWAKCMRSSRP